MCKLLVGISNIPNNKAFIETVQGQFVAMENQPNGIGAMVITHDNKFHLFRSYTDYDSVFESVSNLLPQARLVSVHTRISTGGSLGLENVHFFESDNVLLAHNGVISGYSKYQRDYHWNRDKDEDKDTPLVVLDANTKRTPEEQTLFDETLLCRGCQDSKAGTCKKHIKKAQALIKKQVQTQIGSLVDDDGQIWLPEPVEEENCATTPANPCDSFEFLRDLPKPVTKDGIETLAKEKKMHGMMFIFDKTTGEMFLTIKKEAYAISDKKTFSAFFSFDPDTEFKETKWTWIFGIPFKDKIITRKLGFPKKTLSYGTFAIKY